MEKPDLDYLGGRISDGIAVLFTGAGFSTSSTNQAGETLPSSSELKRQLWALAFPGDDFDENSRLQDVFDAAASIGGNATRDLLVQQLSVRKNGVPEEYRVWFSFPWARHYTLNLDDLDEKVSSQYGLPRTITRVSALTEDPPSRADEELHSIHLNGVVSEYPNVTFSDRQYAERTASPDPWYRLLANDLAARCVVFIGTTLDEPPLWQALELRLKRHGEMREMRPKSFLVTPTLSLPRQRVLEQFNIRWIPLSRQDFVEQVLTEMQEPARRGIGAIAGRIEARRQAGRLQPVASLRTIPSAEPREFLLGREPEWGDVSKDGFAAVRVFEQGLLDSFQESEKHLLIVTGTAGSGKSTTLKRLAVDSDAAGQTTMWLPSETEQTLPRLRQEIGRSRAQVLVIDDIDAFGSAAGTFVDGLLADSPKLRVVCSVRGSRYHRLRFSEELEADAQMVTVPLLADEDIDSLLDALMAASRLGRLRGMERPAQRKVFRDLAGRELLVAMIEATTGERFEQKIAEECEDLSSTAAIQYAVIALATTFRHGLSQDEVLDCAGGNPNEALNDFRYLIDHHLVVPRQSLFQVRHRYIAQRSIDHFQARGQLAEPIAALVWVMAARVDESTGRHSRERQLLVSLLSHEFLIRRGLSQSEARTVYSSAEDILSWDYHFWLQRGAYEVEHGDIHSAKNYLDQARSLARDDFMVRTEWAYMTIKRAALEPDREMAQENVDEAIGELEDAIEMRGAGDAYPYHVLGSQGLSWARRGSMDLMVRQQFLGHLLAVVREGIHFHPPNCASLKGTLSTTICLLQPSMRLIPTQPR